MKRPDYINDPEALPYQIIAYVLHLEARIGLLQSQLSEMDTIQPVISAAIDVHNDIYMPESEYHPGCVRRLWRAVDSYKSALQGRE